MPRPPHHRHPRRARGAPKPLALIAARFRPLAVGGYAAPLTLPAGARLARITDMRDQPIGARVVAGDGADDDAEELLPGSRIAADRSLFVLVADAPPSPAIFVWFFPS